MVAHAFDYRPVTIAALRRAMQLTGNCEMCGAETLNVAFFRTGPVPFAEVCSACSSEANVSFTKGSGSTATGGSRRWQR